MASSADTILDHNWQTGANSIIVELKSWLPYEGLYAAAPVSATPEPASVRLMLTALAGLGLTGWHKRAT